METTKTNKMEKSMKDYEKKQAARTAISQEMCNTSTDQFRVDIANATEGLSKMAEEKYFSDRTTEFFDKYNFDAEPSETTHILTEVFQLAVHHEIQTWLAQKEQFMKYMGCHPARTFTCEKPSDLLKEFGQWLIDTAEHGDYDYMEASELKK
tara:strand:- start:567 stop:1022 length:456 start_codon:yes stop_codon:yes gene_type:complete